VDVDINQSRANQFAINGKPLNSGGRTAGGFHAHSRHFAIQNQYISDFVQGLGGIKDPTAGDQQRIHVWQG
jgi:hypothetical protein